MRNQRFIVKTLLILPFVWSGIAMAGEIVIGNLQDFYRLSGYSSICGWAFNEKGNEAHNVGYYWPEEDVFQKGYWYQININIGAVNKNRKPGQPIATGSANLKLQSEGYLYSPPVKKSFIPVKYYEPLLPGLLSHSAKPTGPSQFVVNCDTVVFVAFMNGDLKTARYFKLGQPESHGEITDEPTETLVKELIREAALEGVSDELPHSIAVVIDEMGLREGRPEKKPLMDIYASIVVERDSQKGIIIGHKGERLRGIGSAARPQINRLLGTRVHLKLHVKVLKEWQRDSKYLNRLGF